MGVVYVRLLGCLWLWLWLLCVVVVVVVAVVTLNTGWSSSVSSTFPSRADVPLDAGEPRGHRQKSKKRRKTTTKH